MGEIWMITELRCSRDGRWFLRAECLDHRLSGGWVEFAGFPSRRKVLKAFRQWKDDSGF